MNTREIEHMWKVASNNPNHDTHWHDPVVVSFANLVAKHTLSNIDPSKFMSYQEAFEAGRLAEREACAKVIESHGPFLANGAMLAEAIRARGNT
jgi:hypothetical protein